MLWPQMLLSNREGRKLVPCMSLLPSFLHNAEISKCKTVSCSRAKVINPGWQTFLKVECRASSFGWAQSALLYGRDAWDSIDRLSGDGLQGYWVSVGDSSHSIHCPWRCCVLGAVTTQELPQDTRTSVMYLWKSLSFWGACAQLLIWIWVSASGILLLHLVCLRCG